MLTGAGFDPRKPHEALVLVGLNDDEFRMLDETDRSAETNWTEQATSVLDSGYVTFGLDLRGLLDGQAARSIRIVLFRDDEGPRSADMIARIPSLSRKRTRLDNGLKVVNGSLEAE